MTSFIWSPNEGIDVSSYAEYPYNLFSPFAYDESYGIPVPGNEKIRAKSVEGIWQGLKVINGKTEPRFKSKPRKRRGNVEGHCFGDQVLPYLEARKYIYVPAYTYHAINNALPEAWQDLEQRVQPGDVMLHDVETNGNIEDLSSPFAHSALLVSLLNVLKNAPLPPFNKRKLTYLSAQIEETKAYRKHLEQKDKEILDEILFAYLFSIDTLKQTFALRAVKETGIRSERLNQYVPCKETKQPYEELSKILRSNL